MTVSFINQSLALLTIGGQVVFLIVVGAYCLPQYRRVMIARVGERVLLFAFIIALTATAGSLFYSEIAGYTPCKLCWFQRIFMYPQVFLFALALGRKDRAIMDYSLLLSGIGGAIAAYHYLLQIGIAPALPCSAIGASVSCSPRFVMLYGYITIPMMALTAFALLIALAIINPHTFPRGILGRCGDKQKKLCDN